MEKETTREVILSPELKAVIDEDKISFRLAGEERLELTHKELATIYRKAKPYRKKNRKAAREIIF
ncbi:MAG: hypothetical protein AB1458_11990 [Bacteroidota bacterium]